MADVWLGLSKSPKESLSKAFKLAKKTITMKDMPGPHGVLSHIYSYQGQHELAIAEAEKSVELAPSYKSAYSWLGDALWNAGRAEEATAMFEKSLRLNPFPNAYQFSDLGRAYLVAGRYEDAVIALEKARKIDPDLYFTYIHLTSAYSFLNRDEDARNAANKLLKLNPNFTIGTYSKRSGVRQQADFEKYIESLRKAGIPE